MSRGVIGGRLALATAGLLVPPGCSTSVPWLNEELAGSASTRARFNVLERRLEVADPSRGQAVAFRLFMPLIASLAGGPDPSVAAPRPPLVLFSHGLGESYVSYEYLTRHWASLGYAVAVPNHAGTDVSIVDWSRVTESLLEAGRQPRNWVDRVLDLILVLDWLEKEPEFATVLDFDRIVVAGHSLGAHTAMALAGMTFAVESCEACGGLVEDMNTRVAAIAPRIRGCIAISPPPAGILGLSEGSWASVRVPLLCVTGTADTDILVKNPEARRAAFEHATRATRLLVTIAGAEHETFTGRDPHFPLPSKANEHQQRTAALSDEFLLLVSGEAASTELGDAIETVCESRGVCPVDFTFEYRSSRPLD